VQVCAGGQPRRIALRAQGTDPQWQHWAVRALERPPGHVLAVIREYGPDAVAAIVQGRLVGSEITEAGLSAQPKATRQPAPEKAAAA
jgi:hypothetical protein